MTTRRAQEKREFAKLAEQAPDLAKLASKVAIKGEQPAARRRRELQAQKVALYRAMRGTEGER
jgi:hypothetical protein